MASLLRMRSVVLSLLEKARGNKYVLLLFFALNSLIAFRVDI